MPDQPRQAPADRQVPRPGRRPPLRARRAHFALRTAPGRLGIRDQYDQQAFARLAEHCVHGHILKTQQ
jgi:hypothetical protein